MISEALRNHQPVAITRGDGQPVVKLFITALLTVMFLSRTTVTI